MLSLHPKQSGGQELVILQVARTALAEGDRLHQQSERVAKMKAELAAWKTSALKSLAGADYGPGAPGEPAPRSGGENEKAKKKQTTL
ncbi:MAG: hypothetical protein FJ387_24620 [Verrucomicrobia bacterium]|nr:hypothetical protein [Verrucomicrobiota bacterium]